MQPSRSSIIQCSGDGGSCSLKPSRVMFRRWSSAFASLTLAHCPKMYGISSKLATFAQSGFTSWYTALAGKFSPAMLKPFSFVAS